MCTSQSTAVGNYVENSHCADSFLCLNHWQFVRDQVLGSAWPAGVAKKDKQLVTDAKILGIKLITSLLRKSSAALSSAAF